MKKAILVVSFGTTHEDTRKKTIDVIEDKIRKEYPDYEVRRAFTAHMIINRLKKEYNLEVDTPEEALEKLLYEGFEEVILQPLHIIPGAEYDYIKSVVDYYSFKESFKMIKLGRPALYFKGTEEDIPDDYSIFINSISELLNNDKSILFMGHGSAHYSNACYLCLQHVFWDLGYKNVHIANVEGYPTLEEAVEKLKEKKAKEVTLIPLMLVAGDHAKNDMAGEDADSWKNVLTREGFLVEVILKGLGELEAFQNIYVKHIEDCITDRYKNLGHSKKALKIKK